MREADEEIREIKKEIIESRGLIIKTNNLTNSLAADVKSIAKRQAGYERRFFWNSAVAYLIFATLVFVGLKLALDARIREIETEKTALEAHVAELRRQVAEETRRADDRTRAEANAARFYELIRGQKRAEAVDGYDAIAKEALSPAEAAFFRDAVENFRLDLAVAAHHAGLELMRNGRFAEAAERLQEALRLKDDAAQVPAVKLDLAQAYRRLGRHQEALSFAHQVVESNADRELADDAMWLVSHCAEDAGDLDGAREAIKTLMRKFPRSPLLPDARKRLQALNQRPSRPRPDAN